MKADIKSKNVSIYIILLISIIFIIGLIIYIVYNLNYNNYQSENANDEYLIDIASNNTTINEKETDEQKGKIIIYITGQVQNPGVYELNENSRIIDAIEKAGGTLPDANVEELNLAYILDDGQKIKIPSINDEKNGNNIENIDNDMENGYNIIKQKININTASISELTTISGIGEATAEKIIEYRKENGKYKSIEELKNISGVGENKFNQIKNYISVK